MTPAQRAQLEGYKTTYGDALAGIMAMSSRIDALAHLEVRDLQRIKQSEQRLHGYKVTALHALIAGLRLRADVLEQSLSLGDLEIPDTFPEGDL